MKSKLKSISLIKIDHTQENNIYYYVAKSKFLSEVAKEQQWNQREALEYLVSKAGYDGKLNML